MAYDIQRLLSAIIKFDGSDLVLKADSPPLFRVYGELKPLNAEVLTHDSVAALIETLLTPKQSMIFHRDLELDFSYEIPGVSRYRVNIFQQRGNMGLVARAIPFDIRTMDEIGLPAICKQFCEMPRGLVLVTGPTGCGKSTSLASMINYINHSRAEHIVTIEDPIEYVYEDVQSLINQRELGTDTHTFAQALKHVLRQDPDVILVGEMRDLETIALAITAAETGHLVFATLHTTDAIQTVDRIIDVFPTHQQQQIRVQLAVNLVGVISQTLLKRADGKGRIAAFETMVATPAVRNLIREGKTFQLGSTIQIGAKDGMMDLDQSLARLVADGVVTREDAQDKCGQPTQFLQYLAYYQTEQLARVQADKNKARPVPA
ncbi:MAG: type IV pilus twitching motility protein PilT [Capsulimonadales bacterium]|nr:type IV pilus twitching motility protein PilT [Capsulimonadales bacterium]